MMTWSTISLQDSSSSLMEQLIFFHDHIMLILMMIVTMVAYSMIMLIFNKFTNRNILEGQTMELIWTVIPALTLFFIATPSLRLLYLMDEINSPSMTIKTTGHQWYWSYEYSDFKDMEFDSYLTDKEDMNNLRLLDVDNRLILPMNTFIRMIVTSLDVIHSWALPSAGVKIDGTPGRLNQTSMMLNRMGLIYGQCSEICGTNHSFMPITVEMIPINKFINWMK
uniref:cytochrome c oxidase subunit II n=1 Tax=Stheneboea repudiosa TaxID=2779127 RepID=UPI0025AA0B30|nr:cytochrome c oxidase subunit II [Stheneboea repudiosa]WID87122.1 cytochrome c oxidase subunit II [Stheneboea repudiosa]